MHRLLRILLLWLLALAIPVQGIAAATSACASRHGTGMAHAVVQERQDTAAMHAMHRPDRHAHHDHAAHGHDVPQQDIVHGGHLQQADGACDDCRNPPGEHDRGSCSACAACFIGSALPGPAFRFGVTAMPAVRLLPLPDAIHPGIVPAGIDRPPRAA